MLVAFLEMLGVDLIIIVVLLASVVGRRRWVVHRTGAFRGAIPVVGGDVAGQGPSCRRGYGRWRRDVLVWSKDPFLFRDELRSDALASYRAAAGGDGRARLAGPYSTSAGTSS